MKVTPTLWAIGLFVLGACASPSSQVTFPVTEDRQGVFNISSDVGIGYVAGQPDQAAFEAYVADGVTAVVNLRTPGEMSNPEQVPFDQVALLDQLGLDYVEAPIGGAAYPYSTAAVDALAQAIDDTDGKVLLHCRSAGRASQVWAAYLVKYEGLSEADAVRHAQAISLNGAFKRDELLGTP